MEKSFTKEEKKEESSERENFIVQFYEALYDTILFQLNLVGQFLDLQKNPLDLLLQYNTKWNLYVASLSEFETAFAPFADLFNSFYEKECDKYPVFPKFTVWRLMVRFIFFFKA